MYNLYILASIPIFLAPLVSAQAGFGSNWFVVGDPTQIQTYILSTTTTLQVPNAPQPQADRLALWPGMETSNGQQMDGLIQSILASFKDPSQPAPAGCGGTAGQWCAFTGVYTPAGTKMDMGTYAAVSAGEMLTITYNYDPNTNAISQAITRNGQVLSTWNSTNSRPYNWDVAVECQDNGGGMTPEHIYHNTQITLNQPDMNWPSWITKKFSTDSGFNTPDGGKTWQADTITIQSANCVPGQSL